jgi:hypothetical protein
MNNRNKGKLLHCKKCLGWFIYPKEFLLIKSEHDRIFMEEGWRCESCWNREEREKKYRHGMGELSHEDQQDIFKTVERWMA